MLSSCIRLLKRAAVLLPVLIVGYLSIFRIFPIFANHLPWAIAFIATYALGAYLLIPGCLRLIRKLWPPNHLPLYCVTADGFASDPLNIAIVGTRQQIITAMTAAGWHGTDPLNWRTAARTILHTIYGWKYKTPPMSPLFLFGRKQDLAFQIPIKSARPGARHHVRFWAATYSKENLSAHAIDWHNREAHVRDDKLLWIGAASRDIGVTFIRHNAQVTHLVDPDTDTERELIVTGLTTANVAKLKKRIKLGGAYSLVNIHALRGNLHTDGRMAILDASDL